MSVSFTWRPVNPKEGKTFASGSDLRMALENSFGGFPFILTPKDVSTLKGMISCGFDPLKEIVEALDTYKKIEIKAQW